MKFHFKDDYFNAKMTYIVYYLPNLKKWGLQ